MPVRPHSRRWELAIVLDDASDTPLYLQIARSISADIRDGRLRAGDALPGSRTLAHALGVHRNTVLAGYTELVTEGWLRTEIAGGTFVSGEVPSRRVPAPAETRAHIAREPAYALDVSMTYEKVPVYASGTLVLTKGAPDVRLLPMVELTRAYRRVLTRDGRKLLTYGDPRGQQTLRAALVHMLSDVRGVNATPDSIMVTRGSQMAIDLLARTLITPGDVVVVEALGHRPAWTAFRLAGAELISAPLDECGLCVDPVRRLLETRRIRAIYITPHHQFPTTVVMPPHRRTQLLELARLHGVAIVEDDYDYEFHYDERPVPPLASVDRHGVVVYVGTLSKILAPGLRIGFVVAPPPVIDAMTSIRVATDLQGDLPMECAIAELFRTGELDRHVRRMRRVYRNRRDALMAALSRELGSALRFAVPSGGMSLWAQVSPEIDVDEWAHRAIAHGVAFRGGRMYDFKGHGQPFTRLGFSFHDEEELAESARRMRAALLDLGSNATE